MSKDERLESHLKPLEITARFLEPPQETQEVLQKVVRLLNLVETIEVSPDFYAVNGASFHWKVRGVREQVLALLEKSRQRLIVPWVGLTEDEISSCDPSEEIWGLFEIARAIEAKLKEKNNER